MLKFSRWTFRIAGVHGLLPAVVEEVSFGIAAWTLFGLKKTQRTSQGDGPPDPGIRPNELERH